jgi:hypothetical protein
MAQLLYCWRCGTDMPMLTDAEWGSLRSTFENAPTSRRVAVLLDGYEEMTGYRETNPNAVFHHVISQYGPPCRACAKPLRTPRASFCAACGAQR